MTVASNIGNSASWDPIDPDPGTFTDLCCKIGARGIQVEQVNLLDREAIHHLRPVYGLMVLIKHIPESLSSFKEDNISISKSNIYFSNQVVHEAYAMHALLNILLNCGSTVDIGKDLNHFKEFTSDFSSMLKGLTLTNSHMFRQAHNSLSSRHIINHSNHNEKQSTNVIYHPISYIHFDGHLWELDGLKRGPVRLDTCNDNDWLGLAHAAITEKWQMYQKPQVPISLWAVIEDRKLVYQRRLIGKNHIKRTVEHALDIYQPDWRVKLDTNHWNEEYRHALNNGRNKRGQMLSMQLFDYCRSYEQLPAEDQTNLQVLLKELTHKEDMFDIWLQTQDDSLRLYENLGLEVEKDELYKINRLKRKHDYLPFIRLFIQRVYEEGHLQSISELP